MSKGSGSLERTDFNSVYFGKQWQELTKELILTVSILGRYLWQGVMLLKEMNLTVSTLGRCGSLEKN